MVLALDYQKKLLVSFTVAMDISGVSKKPTDYQGIKRAQICAEKLIFHQRAIKNVNAFFFIYNRFWN